MTEFDPAVKRLAAWSIAVAFGVMALKLVAWHLTGSVALLSDGLESTVNVVAAVVAYAAITYAQKPADADDVVKALLATGDAPEPPDNPMSADRVRWEHIQRVYELCDHNVSETARRLGMHRRTLQRILAKRAPR